MKKVKSLLPLMIITVIGLGVSIFLTAFSSDGASVSQDNINEVSSAVCGVFETQAEMGMFVSEDGLTSSLTQEEINNLIDEYDKKVDKYYSKANPCNVNYKWLNREYLNNTYKKVIDNCIDAGISDYKIVEIKFSEDQQKADVEIVFTAWNKWVVQDGENYQVLNPVNRDRANVTMIIEDGQWKLEKINSYIKGINGYSELSKDDMINMPVNMSNDNVISKIKNSENVLTQEYDSFEDAFMAAQAIDIENGNYFALVPIEIDERI